MLYRWINQSQPFFCVQIEKFAMSIIENQKLACRFSMNKARFLVLGSASPTLIKRAEFARSLGTSEHTARRYLDILAGAYMVRVLPPWFENLGKRQVKAPKIITATAEFCTRSCSCLALRNSRATPR
jgi:hypothetical protein